MWIGNPVREKKPYAFPRLRALVKATCLRRTKDSIVNSLKLPKKEEINKVFELDTGERELYDFFRRRAAVIALSIERAKKSKARQSRVTSGWGSSTGSSILPLIGHLRRICDHGQSLLPASAVRAWQDRDIEAAQWGDMAMWSQKCDLCGTELEEDGSDVQASIELSCGHAICAKCRGMDGADDIESSGVSCPKCSGRSPLPTPSQSVASGEYQPSVKIVALMDNLRKELATTPSDGGGVSRRYLEFKHHPMPSSY